MGNRFKKFKEKSKIDFDSKGKIIGMSFSKAYDTYILNNMKKICNKYHDSIKYNLLKTQVDVFTKAKKEVLKGNNETISDDIKFSIAMYLSELSVMVNNIEDILSLNTKLLKIIGMVVTGKYTKDDIVIEFSGEKEKENQN